MNTILISLDKLYVSMVILFICFSNDDKLSIIISHVFFFFSSVNPFVPH